MTEAGREDSTHYETVPTPIQSPTTEFLSSRSLSPGESSTMRLPSAILVREVHRRLNDAYSSSMLGNKEDPLDELVFIMLSGKTQETNYPVTFDSLRDRFPTWNEAAEATPEEIESAIRSGGLARKKSRAISALLRTVVQRVGSTGLSLLNESDDVAVYNFL